jgi:hypothetical protein
VIRRPHPRRWRATPSPFVASASRARRERRRRKRGLKRAVRHHSLSSSYPSPAAATRVDPGDADYSRSQQGRGVARQRRGEVCVSLRRREGAWRAIAVVKSLKLPGERHSASCFNTPNASNC